MDESRRVWQKPELIVLVRSTPAEAVLTACKKGEGDPGNGPNCNYNACAGLGCGAPCWENWEPYQAS